MNYTAMQLPSAGKEPAHACVLRLEELVAFLQAAAAYLTPALTLTLTLTLTHDPKP